MQSDRIGRAPSPHGWTAEDRARAIMRLDDISRQLQSLMAMAEEDGHHLLAYLVNMAEVEARYVAAEHRKHLNN
jgi:hypothetical protein